MPLIALSLTTATDQTVAAGTPLKAPASLAKSPQIRTVTLNDGSEIPILAFGTGTAQAWTDSTAIVLEALEKGYRHIDCAWHYKNQMYTGRALRESGIPREMWLFISTKGGDYDGVPEDFDARYFLQKGQDDLGLDCVDLYLIHADILVGSPTEAWKQMEAIKREGLAKSIGVSNFSTKSLEEILATCEIPPAVNQIEFHPYSLLTYLPTLIPLCKAHKIVIECYASLMSLNRHPGGPVDDVVRRIVEERGKGESHGQILLQWAQETTGGVVVTTTNKPSRMEEQLRPFLHDSSVPRLGEKHMDDITRAGVCAPFRKWGASWPYFMKGEGGIQACPPDATHVNTKPKGYEDGKLASGTHTNADANSDGH